MKRVKGRKKLVLRFLYSLGHWSGRLSAAALLRGKPKNKDAETKTVRIAPKAPESRPAVLRVAENIEAFHSPMAFF